MKNKTLILISGIVLATVPARSASLGPATILAGAAPLDNGSILSIGQPLVGAFGSTGGASGIAGIVPALSSAIVSTPVPPSIGDPQRLPDSVRFAFASQPGLIYTIEASTNLTDWTPVQTFTASQPTSNFEDANWSQFQRRFFRVRIP